MTEDCDKLLTSKDIQRIFSIGRTHAYELMRSNGFPTIKVGNRLYVEKDALDRWLEKYQGRTFLI